MPDYILRVAGGITPGVGAVGISGGLAYMHVYIWAAGQKQGYYRYQAYGYSYGSVVVKAQALTLPQPSSAFTSTVASADLFYGDVEGRETTGVVGVGYGFQDWKWVSGPASGTVVGGMGMTYQVAAGVNIAVLSRLTLAKPHWYTWDYHGLY